LRANPNLQFLVIEPEKQSLNNFVQMLKQIFVNFMFVLNGHIGFGEGTLPDNIDGNWVNTTTPVAPNTDFTVDHNLGRLPVGYVPMQKDRAVDIYTGSIPATNTQITLRATVASAVIRLFIVCLVLAAPMFGQSTSVTVNVTDSSGQIWIGGNYKIGFWTNPSFPNGYQWQGSTFNQTTIFTGTMDGSGNFTVSIPDNSTISPSGSAWKFTVCPLATFPCFDEVIGVSGTSQSINIVPSPILISPTPINSAYLNTQSKAGLGALIYQITSGHLYVCTSSAPYRVDPSGACSGWVEICQVGDGLCSDSGTGCTVGSLLNNWIVFIHPDATCIGSVKLTWDNANQDLAAGSTNTFNGSLCQTCTAIGDLNALASGNVGVTYSEHAIGYQNTLGQGVLYVFGDQNLVKGSEVIVVGTNNDLNSAGVSTHFQDSVFATIGASITLVGINSTAHDFQVVGSDDIFTVGAPLGSAVATMDCLHGIGGHNTFTITGGSGSDSILEKVSWVGKDNTFTINGVTMNELTVAGNSGTFTGAVQIAGAFGNSLSLVSCIDCYAVGESVVNSTSNTLAMGMSTAAELVISTNRVTIKVLPFASLPACVSGIEGSELGVSDSTTATWGATVTGGSTNHIKAYCDGTNWTVEAK
jgi:hypothetical protein